ncbi:SUMF1/EgtB/PvdO family nonheme iron enzyme [Pendulispora brunnea]|uniref:SUMF1/EgtB/PvdO family nonheme iron enzyme n=1 Tax=Pendulispora brunnea TaxID=2905690 RepID=A0ABZ2KP44_9BACT
MATVEVGGGSSAAGRPEKAFCIDRTAVSAKQYRECLEKGSCTRLGKATVPASGPSSDFCVYGHYEYDPAPINCVTWAQAKTFCEARGKRLPTEKEWRWASSRDADARRSGKASAICWNRFDLGGPCPFNEDDKERQDQVGLWRAAETLREWSADARSGTARERRIVGETPDPTPGEQHQSKYDWEGLPESAASVNVGFRCAK